MSLNALLAELDPMERTLRLEWLRRRSFAPFIATVLGGTFLIGFLPSVLVGGIISAVTHVVLRNRLAKSRRHPRDGSTFASVSGPRRDCSLSPSGGAQLGGAVLPSSRAAGQRWISPR